MLCAFLLITSWLTVGTSCFHHPTSQWYVCQAPIFWACSSGIEALEPTLFCHDAGSCWLCHKWSSLRRNFDEVDMVTDIGVRYDSKAWGWFQQSLWSLKLGILQTVCFLKQNWTHEWHMSGTRSSHQGPSTSTKGSPCHAPLPGSTPKDCSGQPSGCTGCTPIVPISPGFPWGISCVKFSGFLSTGSWGAVSHFARTLWKKDTMEEAACIDDVRFPSGEFPVHDPFGVVICSLLYTFMLAVCTSCILILDEQIFFLRVEWLIFNVCWRFPGQFLFSPLTVSLLFLLVESILSVG